MTRIGILSDTHGSLDPKAYAALADCDAIIHAGDICGPAILRELETLAPVTAVLGNNDFDEYGSAVSHFAHPVIDGVRFLVGHKPGDVRISFSGSAALAPGDPLPDVIVHGHTHVPRLVAGPDARPASILLCPGAVYRPRSEYGRTLAKMDVENGRILRTVIEDLNGKVLFEK
ncbi:metallophosphoesterase family protein [Adlercreutzia equolifaciens]|uniref:metallophosphoesterase family protein n=1 Tax=Adlercreutzia equolifaciens TaxID=446660 RepID=UPI0023B05476|nr:metallophosphoesterase family protein [Adlercreutzia equolifaciens]MDE8701449.1 metallophosphoesterase family protein [Adlercreutzia equolifaciens]